MRVKILPFAVRTITMSTKLIDISKQLKSFLSSRASSILLKETNGISGISLIEAHIQKRHLETDIAGKILLAERSNNKSNCINIIHVAVAERSRRKGLFTDFLELLERFDYGNFLNPSSDWCVRIDKVMNPVLDECLPKKGYTRIRSGNETHYSYHKIIRHCKKSGIGYPQEPGYCLDMAAIQMSQLQDGTYTDH
ncbi:MAG: hypothetical protein PHD01_12725 [Geobacteraceae bacterium]|nr:hypothetical protein [Geobacteraceae bacterium]